jgi:hypothetical protein
LTIKNLKFKETEKMRTIILSCILTLLVLCGFSATVKTSAQTTRESANGHGAYYNTGDAGSGKRQFSFSAQRQKDGTVKGTAILNNPAYVGANGNKYQAQFEISCMKVVGNIAIFGGTVRRTNDPNLVDAAYFAVQDNGEPGKNSDMITPVFFNDTDPTTNPGDPQACGELDLTPFLVPIESGNIQVKGGTLP